MGNLLEVVVESVAALSAERAVFVVRAILRAECAYARLGPTSLTVSSRISVADGGIDAEVDVPTDAAVPDDCLFRIGLTGIQIKSGTSFKPWTANSIRAELLDSRGNLYSEVQRLADRGGRYVLVCTGHDLTPQQRNQSRDQIASVLADAGYPNYEAFIEVLGASQITEFAERYPGTASLLTLDTIAEGWVVDEWRRDEHMATAFVASREQAEVIGKIREGLQGHVKHIRLLGEPGLGKTRIVLESTRDENIAPYVLYIPHGSEFGRTKLFRQLPNPSGLAYKSEIHQ